MRLYRLSRFPQLDGMGGLYESGRWHTIGHRVSYTAEHPALALAECLAHLKVSVASMPLGYEMATYEVSDGASVDPASALPHNWTSNLPASQAVGNAWLAGNTSLLLPVPSALVAGTKYLVNPMHAHAATHVRLVSSEPFWFDPRFAL